MGKTRKGGQGVVVQPKGVVMSTNKSKGTSTSSKKTPPRAHPVQQGTASASVTINKAQPVHRVHPVQQGTESVQSLRGAIETFSQFSRDMSRLQSTIEMLTAAVEEHNRLSQESNSLSHTTMVMLREGQQARERRNNPE